MSRPTALKSRGNLLSLWLCLALTLASCSSCLDRPGQPRNQQASLSPDEPKEFPKRKQTEGTRRVRKAAVAGSWYYSERDRLIKYLDELMAKAPEVKLPGQVMALISPHAGYGYSGKAAAAGYKLLRGKKIRRVVLLAVSHHAAFRGASIADVTHYETPLGLIPLDREAVKRLRRCKVVNTVAAAHKKEHSLEMQLPLLQRVAPGFKLVPLLLSRMDEAGYVELAGALSEIVDRHTVVVASSDFTHRGLNYSYEVPAGPGTIKERLARLDQGAIDHILKLGRKDLLDYKQRTGATICGLAPVAQLLALLQKFSGVKGSVVSRYTSGDVSGDWASTVSYIDIAFTGQWPAHAKLDQSRTAGEKHFPLTDGEKKVLLKLARDSLNASVRRGAFDDAPLEAITMTASLQRKAGAFVTLKCKHGAGAVCAGRGDDLRGCIGTIVPVTAVSRTVAQRAASAALNDSRFPSKVSVAELPLIRLEVSVLTPPRKVASFKDIVIGRHGIILRKGGRSATFLPQVAPEQGWNRAQTLSHLARKAGLGTDGWRDGASFMVYEAIVFSEGE